METTYKVSGLPLEKMSYELGIVAALVIRSGGSVTLDLKEIENIKGFMMQITPTGKILIQANK